MTFKPTVWYPIATVLSVVNLIAVAFAVGPIPPWHATSHAALAVAFGLWAERLRQRRVSDDGEAQLEASEVIQELEAEVDILRHELGEMQERVDFAERILAERPGTDRMGPQS